MAALRAELERIDPVWDRRLASGDRGIAQLIRRCQPVVGHALLLPFAEAYSVVADLPPRSKPGDAVDQKPLLDAAPTEGTQAYTLLRITSQTATGKPLFATHLSLMAPMGPAAP